MVERVEFQTLIYLVSIVRLLGGDVLLRFERSTRIKPRFSPVYNNVQRNIDVTATKRVTVIGFAHDVGISIVKQNMKPTEIVANKIIRLI